MTPVPGLRERIHARVSKGDLPFRFRGLEPTRTEALADAVIGFAITLAVVSLEVPRDSADLVQLMRGFGSFAVTFLMLFSTWFAHQKFCRWYGLEDDRTVWITGGILFVLVFYTYPLKFVLASLIDPYVGLPAPVIHRADAFLVPSVYGIGLGALALLFWLLHRHAWSLRDVLELDEAEQFETRHQMNMWAAVAMVTVPLVLTPVLWWFPKGTAGHAPAAIAYLVLLLGVGAAFYARFLTLMLRRRKFRKAWRARTDAP